MSGAAPFYGYKKKPVRIKIDIMETEFLASAFATCQMTASLAHTTNPCPLSVGGIDKGETVR